MNNGFQQYSGEKIFISRHCLTSVTLAVTLSESIWSHHHKQLEKFPKYKGLVNIYSQNHYNSVCKQKHSFPEKSHCERCFTVLCMLIQWRNAQVYKESSPLLRTQSSPCKCEGQAAVRETISL